MTFIWPRMLFLLLLLPLLVWGYRRLLEQRRRKTAALGTMGLLQTAAGERLGWRKHAPFARFGVAAALLLFGLARPEMIVDLPRVEGTVILAIDVSNSMLADDLEPTRMEAAKTAVRGFVENQPSTVQIGVVAFSNGGLIVQPPTNIQPDILDAIDRLTPQGGTSLGQGLFTSLNAIAGEPLVLDDELLEADLSSLNVGYFDSSVIVLLSDGENTSQPAPLEIAQLAGSAGVEIFPIGIGSADGAVIELDGFSLATTLDEPLLEEIATRTNGTYFYAEDATDLEQIYDSIDLQLTVRGEKMEITGLIVGLALLFLLVGGGLSMHWFGRIPKSADWTNLPSTMVTVQINRSNLESKIVNLKSYDHTLAFCSPNSPFRSAHSRGLSLAAAAKAQVRRSLRQPVAGASGHSKTQPLAATFAVCALFAGRGGVRSWSGAATGGSGGAAQPHVDYSRHRCFSLDVCH